jgi:hypothetical protein
VLWRDHGATLITGARSAILFFLFSEESMRKTARILAIAAIVAGIALSRGPHLDKEGKQWLAGYSEPAKVDVNGNWHGKEWGQITLVQQQGSRDVTGNGDGWEITGVVSGNEACLLFCGRGGSITYWARLTMEGDNKLNGGYARWGSTRTKPMLLTK